MSIKFKIAAGCLSLALLCLSIGALAIASQSHTGNLSSRMYENGMRPLNSLIAARDETASMTRDIQGGVTTGPYIDRLLLIQSHLTAARNATSSEAVAKAASDASTTASRLIGAGSIVTDRKVVHDLRAIGSEASYALMLAEREAGQMNTDIADTSAYTMNVILAATAVALLAVAAIAYILIHSVLPVLRDAVAFATSIASGNFKTDLGRQVGGEPGRLLASLDMMRVAVVEQISTIQREHEQNEDGYAKTLKAQSSRFEATIDNMSQALCVFDRNLCLVIHNKKFEEMFGRRRVGAKSHEVISDANIGVTLQSSCSSTFTSRLADGRVMEVSRKAMEDGGLLVTLEDITERYETDERIRRIASHDNLTGLPNRMQFLERLESNTQSSVAVFSLDVDGFKAINDSLGHAVGDALLCEVSRRIKTCVDAADLVARIGGDEFTILRTTCHSMNDARETARKVIRAIGETIEIDGHHLMIGICVGIAMRTGAKEDTDLLVRHADLALYAAKSAGHNSFRFFSPEMIENLQRRRQTEVDLRQAVRDREFDLHFQPFFDVAHDTISGFEALLRWKHPSRGFVSPAEFVPIAEEIGLMDEIGLWVLERACDEAVKWPSHMSVSVNLSPVQFRNPSLLDQVRLVLQNSGLGAKRLILEVTESMMIQDADTTLSTLRAFRKMGIRTSMDDFGTGYSSLGYLTRFPFDKVKIDQSFVRNMSAPENMAVVRAVIGLASSLNLSVVAEGVETQEMFDTLAAEGCAEMQGYLFSRPVPATEIPGLLQTNFARRCRIAA